MAGRALICSLWILIIPISLPRASYADSKPTAGDGLTIRDWLAAGSGCATARRSRPGVTRVSMTRIDGDPDHLRVVIRLGGLVLDGSAPAAPGAATFARECALRVAAYPAAGKRIVDLEGRAAFDVRRSRRAGARIAALLDLGPLVLDQWQLELKKGAETPERRATVELHPSAAARKELQAVACAAPQLAGVDLLLRTDRDDAADPVHLALVDGTAVIDIRTADCTQPQ